MDTLSEEDRPFEAIWAACRPYTMTSFERGLALFRAIRHIALNRVPGDFVECGVWRGGSTMIAMLSCLHFHLDDRVFWLFDTFAGMTEPGGVDVDVDGNSAAQLLAASEDEQAVAPIWATAGLDEVRANIAGTGYPAERIHFIIGDIRSTAAATVTGPLALLRLDTDFYDSTKAELEALYPRLVAGGVLLVDDYGHWQGARLAVDEYFGALHEIGDTYPLFHRIDYTGRMAIKPEGHRYALAERYDYFSPTLARADLAPYFPTLVVRDPEPIAWPYLRKTAPHIWRTDARSVHLPDIGVLSVEEAELLYNNAGPLAGRHGLEIGCHYAWSTAHLLAAGLRLVVVDPGLGDESQRRGVEESLQAVPTTGAFTLCAGFSPSVLPAALALAGEPWAFVFIDGDHEGEAPLADAMAVAPACAPTACVMFHDLTSPFVAAGLRHFAERGWRTGLYNTMQIMGIAWRGGFTPAPHVADPQMPPIDLPHLGDFPILSTSGRARFGDGRRRLAAPDNPGGGPDQPARDEEAPRREADGTRAASRSQQGKADDLSPAPAKARRASGWRALSPMGLLRRMLKPRSRKERQLHKAQAESGFDANWYLDAYPDISEAGIDPYRHYIEHGRREGRLGSPPRLEYDITGRDLDPGRETVIVVSHEASRTGAPILALNIVEHLVRRCNVVAVLLGPGPLTEFFRRAATVTIGPIDVRYRRTPVFGPLAKKLSARYKPAYAIVNSIESRRVLAPLAAEGVRAVLLLHEFATYVRPLSELNAAVSTAGSTVCPADIVWRSVVDRLPSLAGSDVHIIPQGKSLIPVAVDTEAEEEQRLIGVLRPSGSAADTLLVIGCGQVELRKGVHRFISVAAQVLRSRPPVPYRFVWIGQGYHPEFDSYSLFLEDQIVNSGLAEHAAIMRETPLLERAYETADLFLLSSLLDPLPNVAIDAMLRGLPIVCFDKSSGVADILSGDAVCRSLVVPYDAIDVAAARIRQLGENADYRGRASAAVRALARKVFAMEAYVAKIDEIARRSETSRAPASPPALPPVAVQS